MEFSRRVLLLTYKITFRKNLTEIQRGVGFSRLVLALRVKNTCFPGEVRAVKHGAMFKLSSVSGRACEPQAAEPRCCLLSWAVLKQLSERGQDGLWHLSLPG